MLLAQSTGLAAALLVGILVGATLVFATPAIIGGLNKTTTMFSTETSTTTQLATVTQPPVTQIVTQVTVVEPQPATVTITETMVLTETTGTVTATQLTGPGISDVAQSCAAFGDTSQTISCTLTNPVKAGHLLLVELTEVPEYQSVVTTSLQTTTTIAPPTENQTLLVGESLSDSLGDRFAQVGGCATQPGSTYLFCFFLATITSSGTDQVTLSGVGNYPFLMVHELQNVGQVVGSSTGTGDSNSPSVSPYFVTSGSFTLAALWPQNVRGTTSDTVGAGSGSTLFDQAFAISEEYSVDGGTTISPFTLSGATPWGELSIALI